VGHRRLADSVSLLLVTPLDSSALEQLTVLLLRHPLATLLDDRAHGTPRTVVEDVVTRIRCRRTPSKQPTGDPGPIAHRAGSVFITTPSSDGPVIVRAAAAA